MVAFVGKEGGNSSSSGRSVVVSKLRERKEIGPVVLLVVAVGAEILFQSLVRAFGLTIAFGVISGGEVESDVEGFGEGTEEVGDELRSAIGGDMGRSSVLGEHVEYEEFSKLRRVDGVMSGDEEGLRGETINDDESGGEAGGGWEWFDEVHGDAIPRAFHSKDGVKELHCPEGCRELFGGKDRTEILRVDAGIAATSLFKIDVPSSSQGIRFSPKLTRTEADNKIEGRKKFRPSGLPTGEEFGGRKVFQVLVVGDDIDRSRSSFEVMSPSPKSFEDG